MALLVRAVFRRVDVHAEDRSLRVRLELQNGSTETWKRDRFFLGWQLYDPESNRFIREGEWTAMAQDAAPGEVAAMELSLSFPPEPGGYRIFVSTVEQPAGWAYSRGERFLI